MVTYRCSACQSLSHLFGLSCATCGAWGSIERSIVRTPRRAAVALAEVEAGPCHRLRSNIPAIDGLLGGGFVPGSSVLLAGPPGAGKSTLVLELARSCALVTLYVTGEESLGQLKVRAERIGARPARLFLLEETDVRAVLAQAQATGAMLVAVDSVQTLRAPGLGAAPGSPTQLRECVATLREGVRATGSVLLLVGQVTKGGALAGPRAVEHAVDVVLQLETTGPEARRLVAVKNRFGPVERPCLLEVGDHGIRFDEPVRR
jgi:DNA repair protein RadA/Sms